MKKSETSTQIQKWPKLVGTLCCYILMVCTGITSHAQWVLVGGTSTAPAPSNSNYNRIAVSPTGEPYMIFSNPNTSGKVTVRKHNGTQWVSVGTEGFSVGAVIKTDIAIDNNGVPYITFVDATVSSKARVMKFNGSSWVEVGPTGVTPAGVGELRLKVYNGNPYICFRDSSNLNRCSVMRYTGSTWTFVGGAGFTTNTVGLLALAIDGSGNVYISFTEGSPNEISSMKFNGTSWSSLGASKFVIGVSDLDMAVDINGVPYVVTAVSGAGGKSAVYKFDGSSWLGIGYVSPGISTSPSIVCVGTKPVVGYTDFGSYSLQVKEYNGTAWVLVGGANTSGSYYSISNVDADANGNVYIGGRRNPSYNGEVFRY
ncbi:MAG: hypothetical protein K2Q22_13695, partial [Cytophagales bacterium]|nr:hypothetical protein [Cytophagales bacterium]